MSPVAAAALLLTASNGFVTDVFVPCALLYMGKPLRLDYLWAAACILGAVYFVFRSPGTT